MNAIKAAHLEAAGKGRFAVEGKVVVFRTDEGTAYRYTAASIKLAEQQLRMFRAAPKHEGTKNV